MRLCRINQYYKNTIIGVCLVFSALLAEYSHYFDIFLGFISLCLFSSVGYIVNDILDINEDKLHPEKKNRPLPSGLLSISHAMIGLVIISIIAVLIGLQLSQEFIPVALILPVSTILYSLGGKNVPILDLIMISINYLIRALAGCVIIEAEISPWLYICGFLFAMFLVVGKRYGELMYLGEDKAREHRKVFHHYTKEFISALLYISTANLLVSYALYVTQSMFPSLIWTLPIFVFIVLRYLLIVMTSDIGRLPDKVIFNKEIIIASFLLGISVIIALYY